MVTLRLNSESFLKCPEKKKLWSVLQKRAKQKRGEGAGGSCVGQKYKQLPDFTVTINILSTTLHKCISNERQNYSAYIYSVNTTGHILC